MIKLLAALALAICLCSCASLPPIDLQADYTLKDGTKIHAATDGSQVSARYTKGAVSAKAVVPLHR